MRWSWKLGQVAGIGIYVHATFVLLLAWVGVSHLASGQGAAAALVGVAYMTAIFSIIVLHELGHALAAKRFGIRTRDITLLPIGGVSRLERMPEDPWQEFLVALAGPAVNVAIAAVIFCALWMLGAPLLPEPTLVGQGFFAKLAWTNVGLSVFNLLPAFPMDGGRVLRALLATQLEYTRATQLAASVGQVMAFLFGFLGLFTNPFLVFIALFVWLGAAEEAAVVQMKSALSGIPVGRVMITDFRALAPEDSLADAAEHFVGGFQHDFPVIEGGELVGVLTRADLLSALAQHGREARVRQAMRGTFKTAEAGEMLERAFARLNECDCRALPVLRDGRLVGIFMPENVGELMGIQRALRSQSAQPAPV